MPQDIRLGVAGNWVMARLDALIHGLFVPVRGPALVLEIGAVIMECRKMDTRPSHPSPYRRLLFMAFLSFGAMYLLMYAMVDRSENVYANLNQAYMAALMAGSMVLIELLVMRRMYRNAGANAAIVAVAGIVAVASFLFMRSQVGINDNQLLRSMIPHHGEAILMCERASLDDPDVSNLCERITASQRAEIDEMKAKLDTWNR